MVDERATIPLVILDEAQHLSDAFLHVRQPRPLDALARRSAAAHPLDRDLFGAAIEHGFKAAGASQKVLADQAMEMLFRSSRGVLRVTSKTLRTAMRLAAERGQSFLDEAIVQAAVDEFRAGT